MLAESLVCLGRIGGHGAEAVRDTRAVKHLFSRERFFINAIAALAAAAVGVTLLSAAGLIR